MRKFKGAEPAHYSPANLKAKLLGMGVVLILLIGAFLFAGAQRRASEQAAERAEQPAAEAIGAGVVEVPPLLPGTLDEVADATAEERARLEPGPFTVVRSHVRTFSRSMFDQAEVPSLTTERATELLAAPGTDRGTPFRVRGEIVALDAVPAAGGSGEELHGSLRLDGGGLVHFIALGFGRDFLDVGSWARLDCIYAKLRRAPVDGQPTDAPLVVAAQLQISHPDLGQVQEITDAQWAAVDDDTLSDQSGLPEDMRWRLLAFVRDHDPESIDWENAPVLNAELMDALLSDGAPYRGQPFRMPVSKLYGISARSQAENPARLDAVTEAWIVNHEWVTRAGTPMFQVIAPGAFPGAAETQSEIRDGRRPLVSGRLIFFKTVGLISDDNVLRLTPCFALVDMQPFVREDSVALKQIVAGFIALAVAMTALVAWFVARDRKQSAEMQRKLVERRRKRREAAVGTPG